VLSGLLSGGRGSVMLFMVAVVSWLPVLPGDFRRDASAVMVAVLVAGHGIPGFSGFCGGFGAGGEGVWVV
jgi:hypothetical protein